MERRLRVGVIFGGRSGEHEVSLWSAESVLSALDPARYEVVPIGIRPDGQWVLGTTPERMLAGATAAGEQAVTLPADPRVRTVVPLGSRAAAIRSPEMGEPFDVIFPVMHGTYGEDGSIQGLLELAGVAYVGSGVMASAVGMDKAVMKAVFAQRGLPIVPYLAARRVDWEDDRHSLQARAEATLGYPMFVKPANLGSSVGISKVHDASEFVPAVEDAFRYDTKIVIEQGISAREVEVAVLGNERPRASVPGEVVPHREFYDYAAKYLPDGSDLIIPAPLPEEQAAEIRRLAVEAFLAVDAAGMARVDFFVEKDTGRVFLNEINTIPGFTRTSMYPKLWEASGLRYSELLDELIRLALERHATRQGLVRSYTPGEEA